MKNTSWLMKHSMGVLSARSYEKCYCNGSQIIATTLVNYSLCVVSHNFPDSDSLCRENLQVKNQPCCTS